MYKYTYKFFCPYWFLKFSLFKCVSQRWFVHMDNQLIELLAVCCKPQVHVFWNDHLQQRRCVVSFFSKLVVKEMSRVGGKHLCAHLFKDNTLDLQVNVLFMYACSHLIVCLTLEGDGPSSSGPLNILFLGDFLVWGSCVCRYDGKVGKYGWYWTFLLPENDLSVLVLWWNSLQWNDHYINCLLHLEPNCHI